MGEAWNEQQSGKNVVNAWGYLQGVVNNDIPKYADELDTIASTAL